jgi:hypothetical protein
VRVELRRPENAQRLPAAGLLWSVRCPHRRPLCSSFPHAQHDPPHTPDRRAPPTLAAACQPPSSSLLPTVTSMSHSSPRCRASGRLFTSETACGTNTRDGPGRVSTSGRRTLRAARRRAPIQAMPRPHPNAGWSQGGLSHNGSGARLHGDCDSRIGIAIAGKGLRLPNGDCGSQIEIATAEWGLRLPDWDCDSLIWDCDSQV